MLWHHQQPTWLEFYKPVQRRNGKTIPEDTICPLCGAPHHFLYDNTGGILRGLLYGEDGSVAVDLPNLGTQHIIILIESCFHCPGLYELEIYHNREPLY